MPAIPLHAYDLDGRRFVAQENDHGLSGAQTVFHYRQAGDVLTGHYRGGEIAEGNFVGHYTAPDRIAVRFQCLTSDGKLLSGHSDGLVARQADGRLSLSFDWHWLGEDSGGHSRYSEIQDQA
jgi:hypothetical protein